MGQGERQLKGILLAIDCGTTSTRVLAFASDGRIVASAGSPITQRFPAPGWVEQDAGEIWALTRDALAAVLAEVGPVEGMGITNQRETVVAWDRDSGAPLAPAIVWQDRRTADACDRLRAAGEEPWVRAKTGLLLDPYFSATKMRWLLDHVPAVGAAAESGRLCFGTVDSWLLFCLTAGAVHATDITNASRTQLLDLVAGNWDPALCRLFGVPITALPEVRPSVADFGAATGFGMPLPIAGVAGDQQAAAFGQGCLAAGAAKCTYGTGIFLLAHAGNRVPESANRLIATRAAVAGPAPGFALEGSVFVGGDAVKWLRDRLGIIGNAAETEALARSVPSAGGVVFVPAFAGLGAPWWEPRATGCLTGLTGATGRAEIVRATLEAMGNQTADLLEALRADGVAPTALRVDGGMTANDWLCQDIADATGLAVVRPRAIETTGLGAAMLAGIGLGLFADGEAAVAAMVAADRSFTPATPEAARMARREGWRRAIAQVRAGVA
jgi:glycerol kinase